MRRAFGCGAAALLLSSVGRTSAFHSHSSTVSSDSLSIIISSSSSNSSGPFTSAVACARRHQTTASTTPDTSNNNNNNTNNNVEGEKNAAKEPESNDNNNNNNNNNNTAAHDEARERLIQEILSRDKEIFELKRQHELSMLRVDQHQRRILKDQEDRGMYYEQNSNVHTFDTVTAGLHQQRSTLYHTIALDRLRNVKVLLVILATIATWFYCYYRYVINPEWEYVERPVKLIGSRVGLLKELRDEQADKEYFQVTPNNGSTKDGSNIRS